MWAEQSAENIVWVRKKHAYFILALSGGGGTPGGT